MTHITNLPIIALLGQTVARAWRLFNNRRQFAELKTWSDDQLKDVGLTRSDVRQAMALPFYVDPTSLLSGTSTAHLATGFLPANASNHPVAAVHGKLAA